MTPQEKRDSTLAAIITVIAALLLVLTLVFSSISYDIRELAQASTPEISMDIDEDEEFIEPELLQDLGEPDAVNNDAPAPAVKGDPKPDVKDNVCKVEPGKNPKPAPPVKEKVSTKKESDVKSTKPSVTDEERKEVTSKVSKGFGGTNGVKDGKNGSSGAGGTGTGIKGVASGRTFRGCPKPQVSLSHKMTVTVAVVINADGNVISAKARGGNAEVRRACEAAARNAKWSAKADAPETKGTITFTITPH